MDAGDAVTKYAELSESVEAIANALRTALVGSRAPGLRDHAKFKVRGEVSLPDWSEKPVIYYHIREERQESSGMIRGASYTMSGYELDTIQDVAGFHAVIRRIRGTLNSQFTQYVVPFPTSGSYNTYGYSTTSTSATSIDYNTMIVSGPTDPHNAIEPDPSALNGLLYATGLLETYEQMEERQVRESIKRSAEARLLVQDK